jgi:hypothetical protein
VRGSGGTWSQQQKLTASDGSAFDTFGAAVAIHGDNVLVGAPNATAFGTSRAGAVYPFTRSGTNWLAQPKLTANDATIAANFGLAMAMNAGTALIGAQGAAYVFLPNRFGWDQYQKLTPSDGTRDFGQAVALSGGTAFIGSPGVSPLGTPSEYQRAVYVFTRATDSPAWSQHQRLSDPFNGANGFFGYALALNDDTAVIGSYGPNLSGRPVPYAAYVFLRGNNNVWSYYQALTPGGAAFGSAVALSANNTAVIGARKADFPMNGAAFVWTPRADTWQQEARLTSPAGTVNGHFGWAVAAANDLIAVGAPNETVGGNLNQGAACAYGCAACPAIALTPATLPNAALGTAYSQTLTASGGAGPYQYALSDGALPPGMFLSATLAGTLTGTPTAAGTYSFTITATQNNLCSGSRSYTLVVASCQPVTINPATLPNGTQSTPYNQTLTASPSGGGTAPYSFAVTVGALPLGLTLSAAGVLSGTPASFGTANFTVNATDATGCRGTRAYTLNIAQFCPTLTLAPATLPNARAGQAYSQALMAAGGRAPYQFSAETLPPGLNLSFSGVLAGTPTTAGTHNIAIYLSDDHDCASVTFNYTLVVAPAAPAQVRAKKGDFDGDGKADLAVWTGTTGNWAVRSSVNGAAQNTPWGAGYAPYNDVIVPGDYDGDGKADHAIWRGADSIWYIRKSTDGQAILALWGANYAPYLDVPTPGDFDGDGKTDLAVWRPTNGTFYVKRSSDSSNQIMAWGQQGDTPVAADFDGDGKCDFAVWRPSAGEWLIQKSSGGTQTIQWGAGYAPYFDVPVVADYDGDGKADCAIWRGQDSLWYIKKSSDGQALVQLWGANYAPYNDVPTPADYDGDGKADIAVWRPANGTWYIKRSSDNTNFVQAHGQQGDTPVPAHGIK